MDPLEQYTGFPLLWIFISSILVFVFGAWQTIFISKRLGISQRKGIFLNLWHTLICLVHNQWVSQVGESDFYGTYLFSIQPSLIGLLNEWGSNRFILYFVRIFSYYLKFSLLTTFLVLNIFGNNAILLIEYFYRKLSINFTQSLKFVF